eukprot:EG_transcript_10370
MAEPPTALPAKAFVGNVYPGVSADDLRTHFAQFGSVTDVQLVEKSAPKGGLNHAFVTFATPEQLHDAVKEHNHVVLGKKVRVEPAVPFHLASRKSKRTAEPTSDTPSAAAPRLADCDVPPPIKLFDEVDWSAEPLQAFEAAVLELWRQSRPPPEAEAAFQDLVQRVRRVVWKVFKLTEADKRRVRDGQPPVAGVDVQVYGSRLTGLHSADSDADLTLSGGMFGKADFDYHRWAGQQGTPKATRLCMMLCSEGGMQDVQLLQKASVPVIKFLDPVTGIRCDLTFNNRHGLRNSAILATILQFDPRLPAMVHFLKRFAQRQGIHDSSKAFLNSYAITILAVRVAQLQPPPWLPLFGVDEAHASLTLEAVHRALTDFRPSPSIASPPASARAEAGLARAIAQFFFRFAHDTAWASEGVSLRRPSLSLEEFHANLAERQQLAVALQAAKQELLPAAADKTAEQPKDATEKPEVEGTSESTAATRNAGRPELLLAPARHELYEMVVEDFV